MFSLFKKKKVFFTSEQREHIVEAIQSAERRTSGEFVAAHEHYGRNRPK